MFLNMKVTLEARSKIRLVWDAFVYKERPTPGIFTLASFILGLDSVDKDPLIIYFQKIEEFSVLISILILKNLQKLIE